MAWRAVAVVVSRTILVACCCVVLVVVQLPAALGGGGNNSVIGKRRYKAMFSFGDSMTDTGNICVNMSAADPTSAAPTAASSSTSSELGLPLLPPSKLTGGVFRRGANMAIVGATVLEFDFLQSIGLGYSF